MNEEFVMRGNSPTGIAETLNFSGHTPGYAYRLTEFLLFPRGNIATTAFECMGSITMNNTGQDPVAPDFSDDALIASTFLSTASSGSTGADSRPNDSYAVINDKAYVTQDLTLIVKNFEDDEAGSVNWQVRFKAVKLNKSEEAVANYKQFTISDG